MRWQVIEGTLILVLLTCVIVFGVVLRLHDPLSTKALGAEDPYSHVVFTKEWQRQGYFADSIQMGTEMYPPGMHAWLATFVPFTGISLLAFARIAPAFFGGLAILGMFALGYRLGGPAAGLASAFLTAVMPEHIFRTELLFPTAMDLALLPVWLLAFHLAIHGERRAGIALFALATVPLAIMHPWAIPLFGVPLALYAAVRALRGPSVVKARRTGEASARQSSVPRERLWIAAALIVPSVAFAMATRWDKSGTGFADFIAKIPGSGWLATAHIAVPLLFVGLLVGLGAIAAALVWAVQYMPSPHRAIGIIVGLTVLGGLLYLARTPPKEVTYVAMIGILSIALAVGGFVLALIRPTALGDLGMVVTASLLPLTAIDLFHSPFWPQRTVVYLCVGIALLGAAAVENLPALAVRFARTDRMRATAGILAIIVLAVAFTGTAVASPPNTYKWYRLYDENDYQGFEHVAAILDKEPDARVFVYTWQPALFIKSLTSPEHVWYGSKFFQSDATREKNLGAINGNAYVLVDKHTRRAVDAGKADLSFLEGGKYHLVYASPGGGIKLYGVNP